jgi:hypothetical protein
VRAFLDLAWRALVCVGAAGFCAQVLHLSRPLAISVTLLALAVAVHLEIPELDGAAGAWRRRLFARRFEIASGCGLVAALTLPSWEPVETLALAPAVAVFALAVISRLAAARALRAPG